VQARMAGRDQVDVKSYRGPEDRGADNKQAEQVKKPNQPAAHPFDEVLGPLTGGLESSGYAHDAYPLGVDGLSLVEFWLPCHPGPAGWSVQETGSALVQVSGHQISSDDSSSADRSCVVAIRCDGMAH
jgi:hypothetical protein